MNDHLDVVAFALELGVPVDSRDRDGETALMLAASYNKKPNVVRLLLEKGANESACNDDGVPVLGHAVVSGNIETVDLAEQFRISLGMPAQRQDGRVAHG